MVKKLICALAQFEKKGEGEEVRGERQRKCANQPPRSSKANDARGLLVGVEHNLHPTLRVSWRRVSPPFASCIFEVEALLVVPGLIRGSQPEDREDDVDGPVAQEKPLVLRFWQDNGPASFGPHAAVELGAGVPQRGHARRWPWNVGEAKCCFDQRDAVLTAGASCWKVSVCSLVEVTSKHDRAELRAEISDEQNQHNADGPLLGALVVGVDVGDCEVGA